jgi:hypothetical protein
VLRALLHAAILRHTTGFPALVLVANLRRGDERAARDQKAEHQQEVADLNSLGFREADAGFRELTAM